MNPHLPSAWREGLIARPLSSEHLPLVSDIEKTAYSHPWSLRHFQDSLAAGHLAWLLLGPASVLAGQGRPLTAPDDGWQVAGYLVAMPVLDELHLLNITVVPSLQGQGIGHWQLQRLQDWARAHGMASIWLEVRASHARARQLYARSGFVEQGRRRDYYPDGAGRREDAVLMSLTLSAPHPEGP